MKLSVKKLSVHAVIPTRGSAGAAGYDLSAAKDVLVPARGKALIPTDLAVAIPSSCYGRVAPRSGLTWKHSLDVGAGVIDYDFRGNVGVILFNHSDVDFQVKAFDRVAQLILEKIAIAEVEDIGEGQLPETVRGEGGFGSTGMSSSVAGVAMTTPVAAAGAAAAAAANVAVADITPADSSVSSSKKKKRMFSTITKSS